MAKESVSALDKAHRRVVALTVGDISDICAGGKRGCRCRSAPFQFVGCMEHPVGRIDAESVVTFDSDNRQKVCVRSENLHIVPGCCIESGICRVGSTDAVEAGVGGNFVGLRAVVAETEFADFAQRRQIEPFPVGENGRGVGAGLC